MQSTVQLVSLIVMLVSGLFVFALMLRGRRWLSAFALGSFSLSALIQLVGPPSMVYLAAALSLLFAVLVCIEVWRHLRKRSIGPSTIAGKF
jgi:hypothetical protein